MLYLKKKNRGFFTDWRCASFSRNGKRTNLQYLFNLKIKSNEWKKILWRFWKNIQKCTRLCFYGYLKLWNNTKKICELTNGILILNSFEGINEKDRDYKLNLKINNQNYTYEFIGSKYFEQNLIWEFNEIIKKEFPNEKRTLMEFDGGDFDFAIAFVEKEIEFKLAKEGKIWRSDDWLNNYE